MLLRRAYEKHYQPMMEQINQPNTLSPEELASAQLGLALLAEQSGHQEQALKHFVLARETLTQLIKGFPEKSQYLRALADCHLQLSRLYGTDKRVAAEKSLAAASALFEKLAGSSEDNSSIIARVDAEMRRAVFRGFNDASPQLTEATRLSDAIEQNWPTNPTEFYKLVSILAGRDSVLANDVVSSNRGQ